MHRAAAALSSFVAANVLLLACGAGDVATPAAPLPDADTPDAAAPDEEDAGDVDAAPPPPAFELTFPQVLSRGGPVIKAPKVVPIVFTGDPLAADIATLHDKIAASTYWKEQAAEYGVGDLTVLPQIVLSEAAPTETTADEIEAWLTTKLTGTTPAFGAPDPDTLYAIFYPEGTTITLDEAGFVGQSCTGYGGYHTELDAGGVRVGYAVMPRCADLDALGITASHELFEWATDPFPFTNPAYNRLDDAHWAWQPVMIGELSDMCTFVDRDPLLLPEIGVTVQRQWSNALSKAGVFPCAPKKPVTWLQAIPEAVDDVTVPDGASTFATLKTKAILVPPGGTKTVAVRIYADQPVSTDVPLRVIGYDELYGRKDETGFTFEVDSSYAKVGSTVKLTITAPKAKAFDLALAFAYTGPDSANFWPVLVANDAKVTGAMKGPGPTVEPMFGKVPVPDAPPPKRALRVFRDLRRDARLPAAPAR